LAGADVELPLVEALAVLGILGIFGKSGMLGMLVGMMMSIMFSFVVGKGCEVRLRCEVDESCVIRKLWSGRGDLDVDRGRQ
jgi:hypothetical protein